MRYDKRLAEGLLNRLGAFLGSVPGPAYDNATKQYIPGTLTLEKGSSTYGYAWKICVVQGASGIDDAVISAPTFATLVDRCNTMMDADYMREKVKRAREGNR